MGDLDGNEQHYLNLLLKARADCEAKLRGRDDRTKVEVCARPLLADEPPPLLLVLLAIVSALLLFTWTALIFVWVFRKCKKHNPPTCSICSMPMPPKNGIHAPHNIYSDYHPHDAVMGKHSGYYVETDDAETATNAART